MESTMIWGRRQHENGLLPLGTVIREDLLCRGDLDAFFPENVLILVEQFCMHDFSGCSHWFCLCSGEYPAGIVLRTADETRLYSLVVLTERHDNTFLYWPKIEKAL